MAKLLNKSKKEFKKIRRWPAMLASVVFLCLSVMIVVGFVALFVYYIGSVKMQENRKGQKAITAAFNSGLKEGKSFEEIYREVEVYYTDLNDLMVTDCNLRTIYNGSDGEPDFDRRVKIGYSLEEYEAWANIDSGNKWGESSINIDLIEVFRDTLRKRTVDETRREWLVESVFHADCWIEVPTDSPTERVFMRCAVRVSRQELIFIAAVCFVCLLIMIIPNFILLYSSVNVIKQGKRVEEALFFDIDTMGHNWLYLQNVGNQMLHHGRSRRKDYAILSVTIQKYENFCNCYGRKAGLQLLSTVDALLQSKITGDELTAHYEKEEFAVILIYKGKEQLRRQILSMLAELSSLVDKQRMDYRIGVYISLAEERRKEQDIEALFQNASIANEYGDDTELGQGSYFTEQMFFKKEWRNKVEAGMEKALLNNEFMVYLLPRYETKNFRIVGAEAVLYWKKPLLGLVLAEQFMDIFEKTGFITQLDEFVLEEVCKTLASWTIHGKQMVPISVYISNAHFIQNNLANHLMKMVDAYGINHRYIEFAVVKTKEWDSNPQVMQTIEQLKKFGFRVIVKEGSIESIELAKKDNVPFAAITLGKSMFSCEMTQHWKAIMEATVELSKKLGIDVIAQQIEKEEHVEFLKEIGCSMIQGPYFSVPMEFDIFETRLEQEG